MSDFIRYAFGKTSLGDVMVAASDRGVVALEFVDDRNVTEELLRSRFMDAKVVFDQTGLSLLLSCIRRVVDQPDGGSDIELDLRGTPYEIQVWNLLREIAVGETTSYGALAAKLGTRCRVTVFSRRTARSLDIAGVCAASARCSNVSNWRCAIESKNGLDVVRRQQTECRRESRILVSARP